jgi:hypothetical protein
LGVGGERTNDETDGKNDREPDPAHKHLDWSGWRESSK